MKVLKKILNTIINILIIVVLVVSVLIAVFALTSKASGISTVFGYTIQTIQSDSMKGGSDEYEGGDFDKGDVIIGKATGSDPDAEYEVGDIVTYLKKDEELGTTMLICHRIVEIGEYGGENKTVYRTKGDNNYIADQEEGDTYYYVPADDIKSVFYDKNYHGTIIKGVGNVLDFLQTQLGFFLVVLLPMIAFFLYELIRVVFNAASYKNEKKKEQEAQEKESEEELEAKKQAEINAAVEAALRKRDEEAMKNAAPAADEETPAKDPSADFPTMTAEEFEEFKKFQAFKKMQENEE
ncbi:MAG: signal peptidase I [Ruminococcus sp.]|nr:signal peptidase I [Ruminococcus sp.]